MIVGVPKEIKTREYRVGMTPAGVRALVSNGHKVLVEKSAGECIRRLIADDLVTAVHDCADGGAAVALAEMALAGNIGLEMVVVEQIPNPGAILFGEDQGRYIVTTSNEAAVRSAANAAGLFAVNIGITGGNALRFDLLSRGGVQSVSLADLRAAHEGFFPALMSNEL